MRKRLNWIAGFALAGLTGWVGLAFAQALWRPLNRFGQSEGITYFTSANEATFTGHPGEVGVRLNASGTDHELVVYQEGSASWESFFNLSGDAQTVTPAVTFNGNVTLGSEEDDTITLNGVRTYNAFREDFTSGSAQVYEEDLTAQVLTDGADGVIVFFGGQIGSAAYTIINADNLAAAAEPFGTVGVFEAHDFVDAEDNNSFVMLFPAAADGAVGPGAWNESSGVSGYCEARVDIADVSGTDEFWFGIALQEAYDAPPSKDTYNTSAFIIIEDNAGDLEIETQLNGGGILDDEITTAWTDGDQFVLRVIANADTVEFWAALTDGGTTLTQVTQTTAVLNFDDGDRAVCVLGWINSAEPADPTVTVDYIEFGVEQ